MKTKLFLVFLVLAQQIFAQQASYVKDLVNQLSVEEKIRLVVGTGMRMPGIGGNNTAVGETEEKVPGAAGTSYAIERLNIPKIVFADGPAGVRISPTRSNVPDKTFYATAFPIATMLASTFNVDLVQQVGSAFGNECKEYGVDVLLAPALNIHRVPLGGRNFEYYSEDPVISGKMASAFTKGVQSQGIGVSLKHFAANNQETNRNQINTIVSERALREIYLKGFEIAVKESEPWTIMSSYNKINDVFTSESYYLLTTILRNEWGFKGLVMTDWFGGKDPVAQMHAGNDLLMPGSPQQIEKLMLAVNTGNLSMDDLDRNVANILTISQKTPSYQNYKPSGVPQLDKNKAIAREAANEGVILLKNSNQTLPLNVKKDVVAIFGIGAYQTIAGGTGSGDVNKAYTVSIAEGLEKCGFKVDNEIIKNYQTYITEQKAKQKPKQMFFMPDEVIEEMDFSVEQLNAYADKCNVGVLTITRTSGEFFDRKVEDDFTLKANELQLMKKLVDAFHSKKKPLVVVLNIGGVIETVSWKDLPDAILLSWQAGQEGGHAVADILSGKVNPSGKLTMTFPVNYADVHASKNFPGKELEQRSSQSAFRGVASEVVYEEDVFVGYRYFDTYKVAASYPFGFGLSYSTFSFSGLKVSQQSDGSVKVNCTVTNTGKAAGKEVVQVYLSAPDGKLKKPTKELKAFGKTKLLKAGEKQEFEFILTPYQLASFDTETSTWITEKGDYKVSVGSSATDLPLTGSVTKTATETILKANKVLSPTVKINILN